MLAAAMAVVTLRARRRGETSWAGLVGGVLALLLALGVVRDTHVTSVAAGVGVLALGGLLACAGWALGFARERRPIAGLGPWSGLPDTLRDARPAPAPPRSATERHAAWRAALLSLGVYALLSLAYFAWPVRGHLGSTLIADNSLDPSAFAWFYAWWPHALLHGHNPFVSEAIFAPEGYNLTWVTSVPGPSLLLAPVTLALGPVVTYNVLALAAPALAAWTAFLLCRHVTGSFLPSLIGGYAFGFSPHLLRALEGSPTLYLVALVPLLALVVLLRLEGRLGERSLFAIWTAAIVLQFFTSHDVLATMTIFGGFALAAAAVLYVERRALIIRTAGVIAAAYAAALVLAAPWLYFMVFRDHTTPAQNSPFLANDLVSWVHPDASLAVAWNHGADAAARRFGGLAYFGVPLLIVVGLFAWQTRRTRQGRLLALLFAVPALTGLGHRLTFHGDITGLGMPWSLVDRLPGLHLLVPQRFPLYAFLAAAVILALWLSRVRTPARWALALLAVAFMLPWVRSDHWNEPVHDPPFFATDLHERHLGADDTVLMVPIIGDSLRWQAEADFGFKFAGGGVGAFPESYEREPIFSSLITGRFGPDAPAQLRRFVDEKGVTAIALDERRDTPGLRRLFGSLGARPQRVGGVLLYRLDRPRAPR